MENQIQLAHVLKTLVQAFYKHLNQVQYAQLALCLIHGKDKIQSRIMAVDESYSFAPRLALFQYVADVIRALGYQIETLTNDLLALSVFLSNGLLVKVSLLALSVCKRGLFVFICCVICAFCVVCCVLCVLCVLD